MPDILAQQQHTKIDSCLPCQRLTMALASAAQCLENGSDYRPIS